MREEVNYLEVLREMTKFTIYSSGHYLLSNFELNNSDDLLHIEMASKKTSSLCLLECLKRIVFVKRFLIETLTKYLYSREWFSCSIYRLQAKVNVSFNKRLKETKI